MKQRYIYSLLFGAFGIAISAFAALFAGGVTAGFFWIFVFGDNEWPFWTERVVTGISGIVFIALFITVIISGFFIGKKREAKNVPVNSKHIIISVTILILFFAYIFIAQRGYIFEKSDAQKCSDLCVQENHNITATELSPRDAGNVTCSCWNSETKKYDEVGILE